MSEKDDTSSKKAVWIGTLCALILAAVVGVAVWWIKKSESSTVAGLRKPETAVARKGRETARQPMPKPFAGNAAAPEQKTPPVIDYDKLKEDKSLRALMDKRKEKYGFEKGVDLIVKPDESVKVGNTVVPMNEILERIRLKEGEVIEKNIGGSPAAQTTADQTQNMIADLDTVEKRYEQLGQLIEEKNLNQNKEATEIYTKEREELGKIVTVYRDYKETVKKIEEKKKVLASLTEKAFPAAAPEPARKPAPEETASSREPVEASTAAARKPTGETVVPIPKAPAPTASTVPAPMEEKAMPQNSIPAADAGTNHSPVAPPQGIQATAGSAQRSVARMTTETKNSAASPDASTLSAMKNETEANRIHSVPLTPHRPVSKSTPPPVAQVRQGNRMVSIESLRKEIQDEINTLMLQKGDLENELLMLLKMEKRPEAYGIYVVQDNDNIWNIHYKFLREYFSHRHIDLSRNADEPDSRGRSSGVGKVLKFSEKMVYIYNIREHRLASDINLIHPLSKIVVFNMARVFDLLEGVSYRDMDKIQFDGENIWLPAKS